MNTSPIFDKSLHGIQTSKINSDIWQSVLDLFDAKKYQETILGVLNYIDADIVKTKGNADLSEFVLPHGSSTLYLNIKDGKYSIKSPFLQLPEKPSVGLLRQIAEINFGTLSLSQLVLRGNQLYFEFESPIELSEPYKIYNVLEQICSSGDYYDDIFIEKFGATPIEQKKVQSFTTENIEKSWLKYQEYLKEGFDYANYFEGKRLYNFTWNALYLTLSKIDYYMAPQGYLRSEIEQCINDLNHQTMPLTEILNKVKASMIKLQNVERTKFETSLYIPNYLISAKKRCDMRCVQNSLRKDYDYAKTEMSGTNYIASTYSLLYGIFTLYYSSDIPSNMSESLNRALENASGKTWKESTEILWKEVSSIMDIKMEEQAL